MLLPNWNVLPALFSVILQLMTTELVVNVLELSTVIVPVAAQTVEADKVILPDKDRVPVLTNANVELVVVRLLALSAPVRVIVPGPPDPELKNTSSPDPGTLAPLGPPDVVDQLAILVVSQVPVPPTQYLSATVTPKCG
jgi:hypothetical protein